jgi:hypothetical protein
VQPNPKQILMTKKSNVQNQKNKLYQQGFPIKAGFVFFILLLLQRCLLYKQEI